LAKGSAVCRPDPKSGKRLSALETALPAETAGGLPEEKEHNQFGATAIISKVTAFNLHPTGATQKSERLKAFDGNRASGSANAQECVHAARRAIPLTEQVQSLK